MTKVAWLGLGQMGLPLSGHLAKAGYTVYGYDLASERVALAEQAGVVAAGSVKEAIAQADIVFTSLFDGVVLKEVMSAPDGIIANAKSGALLVDTGTISPQVSQDVAGLIEAADLRHLRAPISGSQTLAEAGTVSFFVSGNKADFDELQPLLATMSVSQDYVGEGEAARVIKLVINMLVGSATSSLGETFQFAKAWGISRDVVMDAVNSSIVGSRHYASRAPGLKSGNYGTGGPLATLIKDLSLVMQDAIDQGYEIPIHRYMFDNMLRLKAHGKDNLEATVLAEHEPDGVEIIRNPSGGHQALLDADDARYAAMLAGDGEALMPLLSESLAYTHTLGMCQSKDEFMASFNSGQFDYQSFEREVFTVKADGKVGFIEGTIKILVLLSGEERHIHNRFLATWEWHEQLGWQMHSWMGIPVPKEDGVF